MATTPGRPIGQMARSVAGYSVLLSVMMIVSLTVFAPAALFDCAWRNGRRAAVITLALASALAALVLVRISLMPPVGPHDLALNLGMLVTLVLSLGLPALFVLPMVQRGEAFGRVLMTATVVCLLGFGASELVMRTTTGTSPFETQYTVTRDSFVQFLKDNPVPMEGQQMVHRVSDVALYCLPAMRVIGAVLTFALSLVLYGRLRAWREFLVTREPAVAVPFVFRSLVLPEWLLFAFILGGLSPLATGPARHIGINLIALVGFLYLLQGLAIFRWMIVAVGINFLGALFAYATLLLLTPMGVSPLLLSIAGLFDSFFDFRHFNRKDSTHEGHSD